MSNWTELDYAEKNTRGEMTALWRRFGDQRRSRVAPDLTQVLLSTSIGASVSVEEDVPSDVVAGRAARIDVSRYRYARSMTSSLQGDLVVSLLRPTMVESDFNGGFHVRIGSSTVSDPIYASRSALPCLGREFVFEY